MAGIFVASNLGGAGLADGRSIADQLGIQFVGVVATVVWTAVVTFLILKLVSKFVDLRVSEEDETEGLDLVSHDERGYSI